MVVGADQTLRYAITNLTGAGEDAGAAPAATRRGQWLADLRRWAAAGVDFVQLREKSLAASEQFDLLADGMALLRSLELPRRPRLLVNGRVDLALAAGTDGVHLTASPGELRPDEVRLLFARSGQPSCLVSVSCHTLDEVIAAREHGADLLLFGPVFEKRFSAGQVQGGTGMAILEEAVRVAVPVPVLGLGGVDANNLQHCLAAGAAGVAAIRLFASS